MERVSGADLLKMARAQVDRKVLKKHFNDEFFRDFLRILILMQIISVEYNEPGEFGHSFNLINSKGEHVLLELDIKLTTRVIQRGKKS